MLARPKKLEIEDAKLLGGSFKNFSGVGGTYNREGDRFFNVRIDPDKVDELVEQGWSIKEKPARTEDEDPLYFLKVKVRYSTPNTNNSRDPKIYKGTSGGKYHLLTEETVGTLDRDEIERVDVIINPSYWSRNDGSEGYSAYVDEMYVTIKGSRFSAMYDVDEKFVDDEEE